MKQKKSKKKYKRVIKWSKLSIIVGIILLFLMMMFQAWKSSAPATSNMPYVTFEELLKSGNISSVELITSQDSFKIVTVDGEEYNVINPKHDTFKKELLESGVEMQVRTRSVDEAILSTLSTIPMLALTYVFLVYILKMLGGGAATMFKVFKPEEVITFNDVAGMSETKEEVKFAVEQLNNYKNLEKLGARPTKGIIMEGPPGTGKTLLAKAIAGEAGVRFISTSGSDFVEMFVGLGAARVRSLWELAITNAPCVLFIDEIDAVGRRRTSGSDGASVESNQTLNALLQKMDGLGSSLGILVVAATNRIGDLDPALLRPGRFDKHLYVGPPKSKKDRDEILNLYLKSKKVDENFDFDMASKLLFGFSGAEIENTLNEAVMSSLKRGGNGIISVADIDEASMKLSASGVVTTHTSEEDRHIAAVHESGHAVLSCLEGRPISKVSIVPYSSGVGGITVQDIDNLENKRFKNKNEMLKDIKILLAGKVAEEIVLGTQSNGCSNDIERASVISYNMADLYGMQSDSLLSLEALKREGITILDLSEKINIANTILKECEKEVRELLIENKSNLDSLSSKLLEDETIIGYSLNI